MDDEYPSSGGYQNLVTDLVPAFERRDDVNVSVICRSKVEGSESRSEIYPILRMFSSKVGTILSILYNWIVIGLILRKRRPDVIHTHQVFPSGTYALPAVLFGIPIVCTSHGADIQVNKERSYGLRQNRVLAAIIRFTLLFVDRHVVVSKSMVAAAKDAGSDRNRIRVIYNGIDPTKVRIPDDKSVEVDDDAVNVLFLGRIMEKKRPSDVINALPSIVESGVNIRLFMAGSGDVSTYKELAASKGVADRVEFLGYVSDSRKWSLFTECDIFVLPSETEGHPITLLEAGICGLPVVVTNRPPFTELIEHEVSGLFVTPGDIVSIARTIERLAQDTQLRRQIGENIEMLTLERFHIDRTAEEYLDTFKEALDNR